MKIECEYAGCKDCLCETCKSMRKAMEEVENIPKEEIDKMFAELEEMTKGFKGLEGE